MSAWLAVVGLGEDGPAALAPIARALVASAETLIGGKRHLALVPEGRAERLLWRSPIEASIADIAARRARRVVVLASGDPMCYGVGAMLARAFAPDEMIVLPAPGAFALAASRLKWPLESCVALSLHGRPLESLHLHLAPGARLLALSTDGDTPRRAAALLRAAGWDPSALTVLEHMGGPREGRRDGTAADWGEARVADLNLLAIECRPGPGAIIRSRLAGLPDDAFDHDGQVTKREVRAATLASLAPLPGELLWDIGAGCGSVAIEWLRAGQAMRVIAVERDPARVALIARNAAALGVPDLEMREGSAPAAFADLPRPDAVFWGGGLSDGEIFAEAWHALRPGGRLVANAVTLEGEAQLLRIAARHGGDLTRIAVARADALGGYRAFRPLLTVTQLALRKDRDVAP
ncbi:MAG TPA: precorrin-6y C5,15-methyltransferase (decarboxylating) subunit CbiE [Stellaceae bacterium]|nr:precorrin-6y C5,15-methyltransferase (decarboxylating) subunit CbiE [Stellaceae bacterium]